MKNRLLAIFFALSVTGFSQTVEITPFGGYVFGSTLQASGGDVHFDGNAQYGGMVSIGISRVVDVDLIYNRSDTKAQINGYGNYNNYIFDEAPVSINYMMVGATKNFRVNPVVSPYVGMNIGATLFYPKEGSKYTYSEAWFFAAGLNGGAKIYFADHFGLKLQAQMYLPIQGAGFTLFAGTGGASGGVSVYSTMVQFGFTGGLVFRIGKVQ